MHPLASEKRGLLYALAWVPVAGMLALFFRQTAGGMRWMEALALAVPLSGLYAMVCLSSWYLCRMAPLARANAVRLFAAPLLASFIAAGLWIGMARLLAAAVASSGAFSGIEERMQAHETSLWISGVLLFLLSTSLCYLFSEVEMARAAREREMRSAMMAREAELKALRDQISPHFLFNSLNSISALVGVDKQKAREMCALLADFLRTSLTIADRRFIPLGEELALIRKYLAIEQVRFDQRLQYEEQVEEAALGASVPPLLLQPLVENAVKHGISQCLEGGVIRLEVQAGENDLLVVMTNTIDAEAPRRSGANVGLENVRRRLETLYEGGARLTTEVKGETFRAEIRLWKYPPEAMR